MNKIEEIRLKRINRLSKQAQSEIKTKIKNKDDFSGYVEIFYGRDKSGLFVIKIEPVFGNILTKMNEYVNIKEIREQKEKEQSELDKMKTDLLNIFAENSRNRMMAIEILLEYVPSEVIAKLLAELYKYRHNFEEISKEEKNNNESKIKNN